MVAVQDEEIIWPHRKIPFSDVVVRTSGRRRRKWIHRDVVNAALVFVLHLMCVFAPSTFNWDAFWVAVMLYVVTGMFGLSLSYHRNLTHTSFKLPKLLEYLFAYCGAHALLGHPIDWVSWHRFHHQYADTERDPHTPVDGFWFAHLNWIFDNDYVFQKVGKRKNVEDLRKQVYYRFLQRTYLLHPIALGALLYRLGGLPFLVWGMGVRIVVLYHSLFLVNSVCHTWGRKAWNTKDSSKNNWMVNLLMFGEGWHNNHHAFEFSARSGLEWWEIDVTWYAVKLLECVGLAYDVKVPSESEKQKLSLKNNNGNQY